MSDRILLVAADSEGAATRVLRDIITTPGTRLVWTTPFEWIAADGSLEARRHSRGRYKAEAAHLEALAGAGTWFLSQDLEQLAVLDLHLRRNSRRYAPAKGMRAGSAYARILDIINATVAQKRGGKL